LCQRMGSMSVAIWSGIGHASQDGYPTGVQGNVVSPGVNEFVIPNYKQTWGAIRKIADAPEGVKHLSFKSIEYTA